LEQWIVSFNARQEADEARKAIRYEIGLNLGVLANRSSTGECINKRLEEIDEFIEAASKTRVAYAPLWFGRPQVWIMDHARWDGASNAGRASLFSPDEQTGFSDIHGSFRSIHEAQQTEQVLWAQLRSLEGQDFLSETTATSMRSILSQAKYTNWRIGIGHVQSREKALEMGIPIIPDSGKGSRSVCIPIGTPREVAIKQTGSRYGEP
jgi:hypothetical protein